MDRPESAAGAEKPLLRGILLFGLILGGALRVAGALHIPGPSETWVGDAKVYLESLRELRAGRFVTENWVWPPGYPLAALPLAFFFETGTSLVLLSILAGSAIPWIAYLIVRRIGSRDTATYTAVFLALSPQMILASSRPLSDATAVFLLFASALLLLWSDGLRASRRWLAVALSGCAAGLAVLTRPECILAVAALPLVSIGVRITRLHWKYWAIASIVLAPYIVGLHQASGRWALTLKPAMNVLKQETYTRIEDYGRARQEWGAQLDQLRRPDGHLDPKRLARVSSELATLASPNPARVWWDHFSRGLAHLSATEWAYAAAGAIGLLFSMGNRMTFLFAGLALPLLAVPLFVAPLGRFLLPGLPAHALGLAFFVRSAGEKLGTAARRLPATLAVIVIALTGLRSFVIVREEISSSRWNDRLPEVLAAIAERRFERAHEMLTPFIESVPEKTDVTRTLAYLHQVQGTALAADGRFEESLMHYDASEGLVGPSPATDLNRAVVLLGLHRREEALRRLERAAGSPDSSISARAKALIRSIDDPANPVKAP